MAVRPALILLAAANLPSPLVAQQIKSKSPEILRRSCEETYKNFFQIGWLIFPKDRNDMDHCTGSFVRDNPKRGKPIPIRINHATLDQFEKSLIRFGRLES